MNTIERVNERQIVTEREWLEARRTLLQKEKELTRQRDEVNRLRQALPWVKVDKVYVFEDADDNRPLSDLFQGRSQLIVYHFMFGPDWDEGCDGFFFICAHVDAARQHFEHHDVSFAAVSRAPFAEFLPFKKRMGWTFPRDSSHASDFH